jgi:hypothetical protein
MSFSDDPPPVLKVVVIRTVRDIERLHEQEGRKEGRMYYCGGPTKEQAGSVPTYNTSRLYATDVNGSFAVKTYLP